MSEKVVNVVELKNGKWIWMLYNEHYELMALSPISGYENYSVATGMFNELGVPATRFILNYHNYQKVKKSRKNIKKNN